jgi:hypothetical protein
MDSINWLRIRKISLVLLATIGLSAGFSIMAAAFAGGGYACWPLMALQTWIICRLLRHYSVEKGLAIFLSIVLTVTGWVAIFLLLAAGTRIVC